MQLELNGHNRTDVYHYHVFVAWLYTCRCLTLQSHGLLVKMAVHIEHDC